MNRMETPASTETSRPKPKCEGKFVFSGIMEGEGEDKRTIVFTPPLVIQYSIWEKTDNVSGKENYPEDVPIVGYCDFDFGMNMTTPLDVEHNWLINGYEGLSKDSDPIDILMKSTMFDLFHAFFHIPQDPNYTHYHWALRGWLKERVKLVGE